VNGRHSGAPGRRVGPTTSAIFQFAIEPSSYAEYFGTPVWRCNIFHANSGNNSEKKSNRSSEEIEIFGRREEN